jgi:hypothetical protein
LYLDVRAVAISSQPLTAEAKFQSHINPFGFVTDEVVLRQVCLRVRWFSLLVLSQHNFSTSQRRYTDFAINNIHFDIGCRHSIPAHNIETALKSR